MANDEQKGLPSGLPFIAALVIISGAVLVNHRPLRSPRPNPASDVEPAVLGADKIEAMLWQDPFQAALDHERDFHLGDKGTTHPSVIGCSSDHPLCQISELIGQAVGNMGQRPRGRAESCRPALHILLAMMPDLPSFEDQESRWRIRYAIVTALRVSGMVPEDSSHVRYFKAPEETFQTAQPLLFPFELFKPREFDWPDENDPNRPRRVLVIWLPEGAFEEKPLEHIAGLLKNIGRYQDCRGRLTEEIWKRESACVDLIGPTSSTVLASMLDEIQTPDQTIFPKPDGVKGTRWLYIYSPWATASPALVLMDWKLRNDGVKKAALWPIDPAHGGIDLTVVEREPTSLPCVYKIIPYLFHAASVEFVRTVGSDDLLARHVIAELHRRGVNVMSEKGHPGDNVVLFSEWDRFYGRAFPRTFANMIKGGDFNEAMPPNLHVYSYIKGIDGKLPGTPARTGENGEGKEDKGGANPRWTYHANLEVPIGCGQLDYVRRLTQKLRDDYPDAERLKAIGVVGTDVYDKLIVLHALREQFPNTLLFTTDLDARLLHHEQFRWTRNLVVVSHFGLELSPEYYQSRGGDDPESEDRSSFPAFRETYQTAEFLACRAALGLRVGEEKKEFRTLTASDLAAWLDQPRTFEIGRGRAVDLSVSEKSPTIALHVGRTRYPGLGAMLRAKIKPVLFLGAGTGLLALLCLFLSPVISIRLARSNRAKVEGLQAWLGRRIPGLLFWSSAAVVFLFFIGLVARDHYVNPNGEPFSLVTGTSVWPGLGVWLIALVVGVYWTWKAFRSIRRTNADLGDEFALGGEATRPTRSTQQKSPTGTGEKDRTCLYLWTWLDLRDSIGELWHEFDPDEKKGKLVEVKTLWLWYLGAGSTHRRIVRISLCTVLSLLLMGVVMRLFGWPFVPYRGLVSFWTYRVLGSLLGGLLLFVLFFVVDAIVLGLQVVWVFARHKTKWPGGAVARWNGRQEARDRAPRADLTNWLEIQFIARLTETIGNLLYLPAVVLLLAIAGRFSYFDNWGFPPSLIVVYVACALLIAACTIGLFVVARHAKREVLQDLRDQVRNTKFADRGSAGRAHRISYIIEDIEALRRGAFQSFAESQLVHFLLIPSGGVGLLALLPYLLPT